MISIFYHVGWCFNIKFSTCLLVGWCMFGSCWLTILFLCYSYVKIRLFRTVKFCIFVLSITIFTLPCFSFLFAKVVSRLILPHWVDCMLVPLHQLKMSHHLCFTTNSYSINQHLQVRIVPFRIVTFCTFVLLFISIFILPCFCLFANIISGLILLCLCCIDGILPWYQLTMNNHLCFAKYSYSINCHVPLSTLVRIILFLFMDFQ